VTSRVELIRAALLDVEALIAEEPDSIEQLEEGLSVNDWLDRAKGAAREAQQAARANAWQTEQDAWTEMAAIAVRRAAQVEKYREQNECEHDWPTPTLPNSRCRTCALLHAP
jgi:hypothetical protein